MKLKLALAMILLYGGPILTGIGDFSMWSLLVFVVIFQIWTLIYRPASIHTGKWFSLPLSALLHFLMIAGCMWFGLFLRDLIGLDILVATHIPILMSLVAIIIGLTFDQPSLAVNKSDPNDGSVTKVAEQAPNNAEIATLVRTPYQYYPDPDDMRDEDAEEIEKVLQKIAKLPNAPALDPEQKDEIQNLEAILEPLEDKRIFWIANDMLSETDGNHLPNILAHAMFALQPFVAGHSLGSEDMFRAFERAMETRSPRVINAVAQRTICMLEIVPAAAEELPPATELLKLATEFSGIHEYAAKSLRRLSQCILELDKAAA